ncbi:MAG: hypothetical protein ACLVFL_00305 [Eubacterium sp.]|nr:hypothetical protein [uncultured Eubacterium sp.]
MNRKNILKNILVCVIFSIFLTIGGKNALAANKYAYSIGTDYSTLLHPNIDTSGDATNAATIFATAGYKSYYNLKPTVNYMKGNAPNGTRRLGSEIVFLSGHANSKLMSFNYKRKGDKYATGIIQGKNFKSDKTGYTYAGVEDCNMSKTKLFVLAGCETANGKNNIARDVVEKGGASSSIGWIKSVSATEHTKWLKRFVNKLSKGATLSEATKYANSFSYSDYNVKTTWMYGNLNTKICSTSKQSTRNIIDNRKINVNENIMVNKENNIETKKTIIDLIKDKEGIQYGINEFTIKCEGEIIDAVYMVNGCETESGYTIFLENGKIKEVYDNMQPENKKLNLLRTIKPYISKSFREKCFKMERNRVNTGYEIISQEGKMLYNVESGRYEYCVLTDYEETRDKTIGRWKVYYEVY